MTAIALLADGVALGGGRPSRADNLPNPQADPPMTLAGERAEAQRLQAYRGSSAGRAERASSRSAYHGQSDREALATVRDKFSSLLDTPTVKAPNPASGQKLDGFVNDFTAVVSDDAGHRGVMDSSFPVRGKTQSGDSAPIDMGLVDAGASAYAPKSTAADVRIPDDSRGKLRFPDQSFGVSLDGAAAQGASIESNKAFFANALTDTDLVLEPEPVGAELSVVLRSADAPSSVPLRFDLSGGQHLQLNDSEPSSAAVVDGNKQVASIAPATAVDAQGQPLAVSYKVAGDRLVMNVDTSGDVAYPVLVDPVIGVYDQNGWSAGSANTQGYTWKNWDQATYADAVGAPNTQWSVCNNSGSIVKKFYFCEGTLSGTLTAGGPLYLKGNTTLNYGASDWAEWVKYARTDSYIYGFDANSISNVANHAQFFMGIWSANWGWENPGSVTWGNGSTSTDAAQAGTASYETFPGAELSSAVRYIRAHGGQPAPSNPITPGNIAVFGMDMAAGIPGTPLPYIAIGGGSTYSSEIYAPTVTQVSHTNTAYYGWSTSVTDSVSASAHDRGLGMGTLKLIGTNMPAGATTSACTQNGAPANTSGLNAQNYYDTCTLDLSLPYSANTTYTAPEGQTTYTARATDLVGNQTDSTWVTKVDSSNPGVALSGSLYDRRGQTLPDGTYDLTINATDGSHASAAAERSGVKSVEVRVNGDQEEYWEQTCATSSCPMTQTWQFNTQDWPASEQVITVVVTDQLDHSTTSEEIHVTPSGSAVPDIGLDVADIDVDALTDPPVVTDTLTAPRLLPPLFKPLKDVANALDDATIPSGTPIAGEDTAEADRTEENVFVDDIGSSGTFTAAGNNTTTTVVGKNRDGIANEPTRADANHVPPDPTGAMGPDRYVEATNARVAIYRRSDMALMGDQALSKFVRNTGDDVYDPQINWDAQSKRWLFVAVYSTNNRHTHRLAYRWSKSQDPALDNWCPTRFTAASALQDDYPKLGHNRNFLIVGSNVYDTSETFQGSRIFVATKPGPKQTGCPTPAAHRYFPRVGYLKTADDQDAFTPVPANTIGRPYSGYIVAADYPGSAGANQIMVWHINGSPSSPGLTRDDNINVSTYAFPPDVPQPNSSDRLESWDTRLMNAVAAVDPDDGKLTIWTQHTIRGPENRAAVRWYEIQPPRAPTDPRTPRQQGLVQSANHHAFNAAISPAGNGNDAAINYAVGGRTVTVRLRARTRHGNTAPGTMLGEVTLVKSPDSNRSGDCLFPGDPCRWGDYAGASPDPSNPAIIWGSNEYTKSLTGYTCPGWVDPEDPNHAPYSGPCPHWGTRNFALRAP